MSSAVEGFLESGDPTNIPVRPRAEDVGFLASILKLLSLNISVIINSDERVGATPAGRSTEANVNASVAAIVPDLRFAKTSKSLPDRRPICGSTAFGC